MLRPAGTHVACRQDSAIANGAMSRMTMCDVAIWQSGMAFGRLLSLAEWCDCEDQA